MSVVDDNGLLLMTSLGQGTRSTHGLSGSMWTTEGFLSIKDGTDEELYVRPSNTIFNLEHSVAFSTEGLSENRPNVTGYQTFTLQEITAKYLKGLQASTETIVGRNITSIYIVMPDGIDLEGSRRNAISDAAADAGLRLSRMYRKSIAAAVGFYNGMEYDRTILFYHVGSSTLEVSVLLQDDGVFDHLSVVNDQHLGGSDFNKRVVNHLLLAHETRTSQDLSSDDKFMIHLGREVEKAKQALSSQNSVRIEIESSSPGRQNFSEVLTRSRFEDLNMDLFAKTIAAVDRAIKDANMTRHDIQDIVLSGGSSKISFLQSTIRDYFGGEKNYFGSNHPETATIFGASKLMMRQYTSDGGVCCFWTDPLSLGIETAGGVMFKYADRHSARQFDKTFTFSTAMDNQDRVVIRVFEGERAWTSQNAFLGGIELSGIPPAPKGVPQIRVRLSVQSCSDTIHLSVMEMATMRINATTMSPQSAFEEDEEIESKLMEGLEFELEDRLIWENAEATGTMTLLNPA